MAAIASSLAQLMAQLTDEDLVQAWQLIHSMRPHLQQTVSTLLETPLKRYEGYLNDVSANRGYGFIVSPEVTLDYGKDAFVSTNETGAFQNKQTVTFTVVWNKSGDPQARLVTSADGTVPVHVHEAFKSIIGASTQDSGQPPLKRSRVEMESGVPDANRRYVGTLTAFYPDKHCGFVKCDELYGHYQKDVFVSEDELPSFELGLMISFQLVLNARGHPQARNVGPREDAQAGPSSGQQWQAEALGDGNRYVGTVQSFWPEKFCGFLQCSALYEHFKKDVFVGIDEIKGYDIGQSVSFRLVLNAKGHPQARDVGPPEMANATSAPTKTSQQGEDRYTGNIQSFIAEKHCGFIHCKELYTQFGKDIFVAVDEMGNFNVGDNVSFRLTVNARGMPQARELGPPAGNSFDKSSQWGGSQVKPPARVVAPPRAFAPSVVKPPTAAKGFEQDDSKRYSGSLQSVMPEKHCGFISCSELYPTFKKDVFISEEEILSGNFQIGDIISFRVVVSARGHPQARDVGPAESSPAEFSEPPGLSEFGGWSDTGGL